MFQNVFGIASEINLGPPVKPIKIKLVIIFRAMRQILFRRVYLVVPRTYIFHIIWKPPFMHAQAYLSVNTASGQKYSIMIV